MTRVSAPTPVCHESTCGCASTSHVRQGMAHAHAHGMTTSFAWSILCAGLCSDRFGPEYSTAQPWAWLQLTKPVQTLGCEVWPQGTENQDSPTGVSGEASTQGAPACTQVCHRRELWHGLGCRARPPMVSGLACRTLGARRRVFRMRWSTSDVFFGTCGSSFIRIWIRVGDPGAESCAEVSSSSCISTCVHTLRLTRVLFPISSLASDHQA